MSQEVTRLRHWLPRLLDFIENSSVGALLVLGPSKAHLWPARLAMKTFVNNLASDARADSPSRAVRELGQIVVSTLRAMGQVAFANNALSGLLIFAGCCYGSLPRAGESARPPPPNCELRLTPAQCWASSAR